MLGYCFPLPMVPALKTDLELSHGERGYLLSIWERSEDDYVSVLDTKDLDKMRAYIQSILATKITDEEIP